MLDFSSSGQANREVTQILVDGVLFANAIELSSWNQRRIQLIVCEDCGIEHCAQGGWLTPHVVGTDVIFTPAFSDMLAGATDQAEYAPPGYVKESGIPLFTQETYAILRRYADELPSPGELPELGGADLVRCVQWEAPMRILGCFPEEVALRRNLLVAVSEGDVAQHADNLSTAIKQLVVSKGAVPAAVGSRGGGLNAHDTMQPPWRRQFRSLRRVPHAAPTGPGTPSAFGTASRRAGTRRQPNA